ncbi:MAG TPA: TetR/AcrR family transcriptional regulator [Candidatus Dormibacteraeota bacterium]
MARTLDPVAHAGRRDEFLDAAQALIQTSGYEQMTIQDILDRAEASRGAFYHYFDSKAALLEALVERLVSQAMAAVTPIVANAGLTATEKFTRLFASIGRWKTERRELMLALLRVWYSDDNAVVREKQRQLTLTYLAPPVAGIIEQGRAEGVFTASPASDTARVVLTLLYGASETAGQLFFARQARTVTFETVEAQLGAYAVAVERVLGVTEGSLPIVDDETLHAWFE